MSYRFLQQNKKGFTLVEMIIYITIIVLILLVVLNTLLSYTSSYRQLSTLRSIDQSAMTSLEYMTRTIHSASSVDAGNSTFGSSAGVLSVIQTTSGVSTTTKFYIQNGVVKVDVNGTYQGPLTLGTASTTNLTFTLLNANGYAGIKIDMTLVATSSNLVKTKKFHTTILLNG